MNGTPPTTPNVLAWPKRLLSADDLRRHLTNQRELLLLPQTVITPLAADELRVKGVRIIWQTPTTKDAATPKQGRWIYAQEKPDALIESAIKALEREGVTLMAVGIAKMSDVRTMAESILCAGHLGGIAFCGDPGLVSCIANKIAGVRAASAINVAQVVRAKKNMAANLYAIEMPGRTLFEVRHMLKTIVTGGAQCPNDIADVLKELDGHAHR